MDKVIKNKRALELMTSRSSGYETSSQLQVTKQVQKFMLRNKFTSSQNFFISMYYLTKFNGVIAIKRFLSYSKTTLANLCKPIHDIINYSTSICLLEFRRCGKEGKKLQKFEYLENEKSFFNEMKNIFIAFDGLSFSEK